MVGLGPATYPRDLRSLPPPETGGGKQQRLGRIGNPDFAAAKSALFGPSDGYDNGCQAGKPDPRDDSMKAWPTG